MSNIERFLDADGKLKQWPAKQAMKDEACASRDGGKRLFVPRAGWQPILEGQIAA